MALPRAHTPARLLAQFRRRGGLTQDALAAKAGVAVRTIRDLEHGSVRRYRPDVLHRISTALGLTAEEHARSLARICGDPPRPGAPQVAVLGPVRLGVGEAVVAIGSPPQRLLLALLAVRPGDPVSVDEITEVLWAGDPPRTSRNLVHGYVLRLRGALHGGGPGLRRQADGYLLDPELVQTDTARFDRLHAEALDAAGRGADEPAFRAYEQALLCWRGPYAADVRGRLAHLPAVVALEARRLATALGWAELALRAGRPDAVTAQLAALAQENPLHEALHALLISALAASGDQAGALRRYDELRARLSDELGVTPSPAVQEVFVRVLRQQAGDRPAPAPPSAAPARPAQLPLGASAFTGRHDQLDQLDALLARRHADPAAPAVAAVVGMAGVGKTALAVQWAHRSRAAFPDGQLFVNLRGHSRGTALPAVEALGRLLAALGVPPARIPADEEQAAGLYRSATAESRHLVVLDDALDADQVRPLLPAGRGCLTLVTSRHRLDGLVAREGARRLTLRPLTTAESLSLLRGTIGTRRVAAEQAAAARLAQLCAHLPLALRIAAAGLHEHDRLDEYAAAVAADGLDRLGLPGDEHGAVRSAFTRSYDRLPEPGRRLFRLLGLVPGPGFTRPAAAALAGLPRAQADPLLDRLAAAHLVEQPVPGGYTFHDLLRLYAAERAEHEEPAAARQAAVNRLLGHLGCAVDAAAERLYPQILRLPVADRGGCTCPEPDTHVDLPDAATALAWLDAQRPHLVAAIVAAARHGAPRTAWRLADGLRGFFQMRMHMADWELVGRTALAAADTAAAPHAQAASLLSLAAAATFRGRPDQAIELFQQAAARGAEAGWTAGQAAAVGNLGAAHQVSGAQPAAAECYEQALALNRQAGDLGGEAVNLVRLGGIHFELGRLDRAVEMFRSALAPYRQIGASSGEAFARNGLGQGLHHLGRHGQAEQELGTALAAYRSVGDRIGEADLLAGLAALHRDTGRTGTALAHAQAAVEVSDELEHQRLRLRAYEARGTVHAALGQDGPAREDLTRALELAEQTGQRFAAVEVLLALADLLRPDGAGLAHARRAAEESRQAGYRVLLGRALHQLAAYAFERGDTGDALGHATAALSVHRETGHRLGSARTLLLLADVHAAAGEDGPAAAHRRDGTTLLTELGSPAASRPAGPAER
ncbi:tetratricopeptide repeat protein [Catellatospora sp. NPDC049609]|uniref:tetratricopeptide repeat protein n=1 Tax=Catellatospora sp. NPDC049609 TaxID=3155505 RepID=UPI00343EB867